MAPKALALVADKGEGEPPFAGAELQINFMSRNCEGLHSNEAIEF